METSWKVGRNPDDGNSGCFYLLLIVALVILWKSCTD